MADEIPSAGVGSDMLSHIEARLKNRFAPSRLVIEDESAAHTGHAGARAGKHFRVLIVSGSFVGQTRIARHRGIYETLNPWMREGIHALAITALTPEEFSGYGR